MTFPKAALSRLKGTLSRCSARGSLMSSFIGKQYRAGRHVHFAVSCRQIFHEKRAIYIRSATRILESWVAWNEIIIIKSNLNKTSAPKKLAKHISISLYAISKYLSINLFMAVWFCQRVASQRAQLVKESDSFFRKLQIKTVLAKSRA